MILKDIQVPKNQYPNIIRDYHKNTYILSLQSRVLRFKDDGKKYSVNFPHETTKTDKIYFLKNRIITDLPRFGFFGSYDPSYIVTFSSPKEALEQALKEDKKRKAYYGVPLKNTKEYITRGEYLKVFECKDIEGNLIICYRLYLVEVLSKIESGANELKQYTSPYSRRNLLDFYPSRINSKINWTPDPVKYDNSSKLVDVGHERIVEIQESIW